MPSVVNDIYEFGEFRLDVQNRVLRRGRDFVRLTPKAFEVLLVLVQKSGQVIAKDELMNAVWPDSFVEEANLTQRLWVRLLGVAAFGRKRQHRCKPMSLRVSADGLEPLTHSLKARDGCLTQVCCQ